MLTEEDENALSKDCVLKELTFLTVTAAILSEDFIHTRSDNKVRELATVCLPWQQWRETSLWFDDAGTSAFYRCVVADL
jgi:hypothetical protein